MNARRHEFFRPLVESLEPRRLLACEVLFQDGQLTILGDSSDNAIEVFVDKLGIHVTCDGARSGPYQGVQSVLVLSGAGHDANTFDADEALGADAIGDTDGEGLPEVVDFWGGPGVDAFHVIASPTRKLGLHGGENADSYAIQFGRLFGSVRVADDGARGRDELHLLGTEFAEKIELDGGGVDGWIAKWEGPDLSGSGNEVAIESIEIAHEGIELGEVETGDGNDQVVVDDRTGLLHLLDIKVLFQGGNDRGQFYGFHPGLALGVRGDGSVQFIGEQFNDQLTIIGSDDLGERFAARSGAEGGLVKIGVTDIITKRQLASVSAADLKSVTIKGGDGDDEFDVDVNEDGLVTPIDLIGGGGNDKLTVLASRLAELIEIIGVLREVPDPLIRGTNLATGAAMFEVSVFETEAIAVDSRGGDDHVVMTDNQSLLSGIDWTIDLGEGDNRFEADLVNPFGAMSVAAGRGNDVMHTRAELDDRLGSAHPDFLWTPTYNPGAGDDQTTIVIFTRTGNIGPFEGIHIGIDMAAGDDTVELNAAASVTELTVVVYAGRGQDTVDVQMAALPDVLQVFMGQGDDDVSMVFANNPNVPQPPPEPDAPVPEILVDVGAGVDSVVLDVFGSLAPPPSDLEEIGVQVTLQEVLASIFITGVGLLALETLFPLGALDMAQAIRDDRAGHTKTEAAITIDGADLAIDLSTGATLDSILIGLLPQPDSKIDLNVNTGREDDRIEVRSTSLGDAVDLSLAVDPGTASAGLAAVGDEVVVGFEHGDPDQPIIIGSLWNSSTQPGQSAQGGGELSLAVKGQGDEFFLDFDLTGRAEIDNVQFDAFFPVDPCRIVVDIGIATGADDDLIDVEVQSAAESLQQKVRIDSGAGDDEVTVKLPAVRTDGLADLIVGAGPGDGPHVKAFDAATHAETQSFFAYDPGFAGGVRVAAGDVNGDGVADIVTAAGPGAGPHVKVFDGRTGTEIRSFFAYGAGFAGGVFVAAGDINGDGFDDVVTGAGQSAPGGHVKVFDGRTGAELHSFLSFDTQFVGGVQVAAGDVNGDGRDDIIVGAGAGAPGGHVKVFDGASGAEINSFFAYGTTLTGGVFVAAGDINGDGRDDIVTGAGTGVSHVKVFDGGSLAELRSFLAYSPTFAGGVRVAAGDVNGDGRDDIITGAGPGAPGGHVKVFDGRTHAEMRSFFAFDPTFSGGVFVAAGDVHSAAKPRRLDLDLAIDTAGGADAVEVELGATASEELLQKVRISTGDGADRASVIWQKLRLKTEFPNAAAADLNIDTGAGDDRAEVELQPGNVADNLYSFKLRLGAGNDIARYWVFGTELPPEAGSEQPVSSLGQFELQVLGELGNDDIQGQFGTSRDRQFLPVALGNAKISIDGGGGRDRVSLDYRGAIPDESAVDVILRGGAGDDQVRARFELDPRSTGKLSAQILGEADNDELGLAVLNADDLDLLFALLDGGPGRDRCRTTPNVTVKNCP